MELAPHAGQGGFLNYIGFTLLGVLTIICYLVLVRGYYRQKNWIFAHHQCSGNCRAVPGGIRNYWAAAGTEQRRQPLNQLHPPL
jgi:hypothetical protein